jgi:hypothetical protein
MPLDLSPPSGVVQGKAILVVVTDSPMFRLFFKQFSEIQMMKRRVCERFQLVLPTRVEVVSSDEGRVFEARTRDISAKGAFLSTREALPEGTEVRLNLTIENERIRELTGTQGFINVEGKVVRSTPEGIAICFDGEAKILGMQTS